MCECAVLSRVYTEAENFDRINLFPGPLDTSPVSEVVV
jgi:hypothetical protein